MLRRHAELSARYFGRGAELSEEEMVELRMFENAAECAERANERARRGASRRI
jgi:hypothetical protein